MAFGTELAADGTRTAIRSTMADDPTFAPLLDLFVAELPDRLAALQSAWESAALEDLRTLAHQLKGAGGGYGYPDVTDAARDLEASINAGEDSRQTLRLINELNAVIEAVIRGRA